MPEILTHKKFQAAFVAALISFAGIYLGYSVEQIAAIISPILFAIGGQALADLGKEKALVEAAKDAFSLEDLEPELPEGELIPRKVNKVVH